MSDSRQGLCASKTPCSWVHGEACELTCFSLAPKFKDGTKPSKLDPDEKTSPTSPKNFRSLRCSQCTWSCWWGCLTDRGQVQGKKATGKGKTGGHLLSTWYRWLSGCVLWGPRSQMSPCRSAVGCQTLPFRVHSRSHVSWQKNRSVPNGTVCRTRHANAMSTRRVRTKYS